MDEVEVEVVQLQVLEGFLAGWEDFFWGMVLIPVEGVQSEAGM